ncbi:MAG: FHA domain-containing protein [Methylobacter sp.]
MAKLTVCFKDKTIRSSLFTHGVVHIGRDDTNDVVIDSLAVAPAHAAIVIRDNDYTIKQLNDGFPLVVNGIKVKSCSLNNNDVISMGKHDLIFSTAEPAELSPIIDDPTDEDLQSPNQENPGDEPQPTANLQFMSGNNIGKVLPLKKAMTRLGHDGDGVIAISKRKEGYFVSVLENRGTITVNNEPLNDKSLKLETNDVLVINKTSLQFFLK